MNNIEKTRIMIRENRLQKYSRILSNRYNLTVKLSPASTKVGCCDTTSKIWINSKIDEDEIVNLILQKAVILHEDGHILFTNSKLWRDKNVDKNLANIIEDGRVEEAMCRLYPKARLYFTYTNRKLIPFNEVNLKTDEHLVMELILREAKKRVGIPQLPKQIHDELKTKFPKEYPELLSLTRNAVNARTEKLAYEETEKLELLIREMFKKNSYDKLAYTKTSSQQSMETCGSSSRMMPKEVEDKLAEILEQEAEHQLKGETKEQQEQDTTETTGKQSDDITDDDSEDTTTENKKESTGNIINDNEPGDGVSKQLKSILNQVEDKVTRDAEDDLRNETEILKSREAESDFSEYDDIFEDELKVSTGHYGTKVLPVKAEELNNISNRISHVFRIIAERGNNWDRNQTRGKLEIKNINKILNNQTNTPKIFRKKVLKDSTDLSVSILLDASGSMNSFNRKYDACETAYVLSKALELNKYESEVIMFGVSHYARTNSNKPLYGVKSFNQKMEYAKRKFIPTAAGMTPLLPALKGAERTQLNRSSKRKVVFVITDGHPDDIKGCKEQIRKMEKENIIVIGVLISSFRDHGLFREKRQIRIRTTTELQSKMVEVLKNIILSLH